jgi:hypothetical protein
MAGANTKREAAAQDDGDACGATRDTKDAAQSRGSEGLHEQVFRFMDLPQERK